MAFILIKMDSHFIFSQCWIDGVNKLNSIFHRQIFIFSEEKLNANAWEYERDI